MKRDGIMIIMAVYHLDLLKFIQFIKQVGNANTGTLGKLKLEIELDE